MQTDSTLNFKIDNRLFQYNTNVKNTKLEFLNENMV